MVDKKYLKICVAGLAVTTLVIGLSVGLTQKNKNNKNTASSNAAYETYDIIDTANICYDKSGGGSGKSGKSGGGSGGSSKSGKSGYSGSSMRLLSNRELNVPGILEAYGDDTDASTGKRRKLRHQLLFGRELYGSAKSGKSSGGYGYGSAKSGKSGSVSSSCYYQSVCKGSSGKSGKSEGSAKSGKSECLNPSPGGGLSLPSAKSGKSEGYPSTKSGKSSPTTCRSVIARDDIFCLNAGAAKSLKSKFPVLENDTGENLIIRSIPCQASNGFCSIDDEREIKYVPDTGMEGRDQCTYEACDGYNNCDTAVVDFIRDCPLTTTTVATEVVLMSTTVALQECICEQQPWIWDGAMCVRSCDVTGPGPGSKSATACCASNTGNPDCLIDDCGVVPSPSPTEGGTTTVATEKDGGDDTQGDRTGR